MAPPAFPPIQTGAGLILAWQIKDKPVLLIGGGVVAAGRLSALLDAGAIVTLITPASGLSPEVAHRLAEGHGITYHDRIFAGESDLDGMEMVLTAIDEPGLSSKICIMCRERRIAVNVADVPPECDFYFGSMVRRGPLQIMVSTGGSGPRIAARVRRAIESVLPPTTGQAIINVGILRQRLRKMEPGADVDAIKRRMGWMIEVCDKWKLDELARMDDDTIDKVLAGWESGRAMGYWETRGGLLGLLGRMGVGRCPVRESPDGNPGRCPFILFTGGATVGIAFAGVAVVGIHKWCTTMR
jgi:precorrin-2 dehydrogenase/sirohydrochlorin ferrochelatase